MIVGTLERSAARTAPALASAAFRRPSSRPGEQFVLLQGLQISSPQPLYYLGLTYFWFLKVAYFQPTTGSLSKTENWLKYKSLIAFFSGQNLVEL